MGDQLRFRPAATVMASEVEGEMVLLQCNSATYFSLNRSATRVWKWLYSGVSVGGICQRLIDRLGAPPRQAGRDARRIVAELCDRQLIEPRT